jgi:hypothetical protein
MRVTAAYIVYTQVYKGVKRGKKGVKKVFITWLNSLLCTTRDSSAYITTDTGDSTEITIATGDSTDITTVKG